MELSEYKQLFLSEAEEILNASNNVLVKLEKEPTNTDLLNDLFRQSHTLKSMAQSMAYDDITSLTHSMETTLALLRSGEFEANNDTLDLLFKTVDALGILVEEVREGKIERSNVAPLVERFEEVSSTTVKGERKPEEGKRQHPMLDDATHCQTKEKHTEETPLPASSREAQTIRIPRTQLDSLMDVTGELVINRIRLAQIAQTVQDDSLGQTVAQITRLTTELQDQMMQIRLVPLEYIFTSYHRLVRDMAVDQKKEVDLIIEGSNIGLDRSIQDEINEPLLHLLKNAVTHGIEEPEKRQKLEKTRRGKIKLIARREKNFVVIELSDDGQGIDINEIKKVALERGIITGEELSALTPGEIAMLITYPGYSGAKKVTEAAGRGMGLNAVRVKVELYGGKLSIDTSPDEGTAFYITLPLTIAIVPSMLVGIAGETYCIPLSYIAETIEISPREIKTIDHHEVISHRDTVLPLIRLREKLGFPASDTSSSISTMLIVVVEVGSKNMGLVVDSLLGQQETVIKPLSGVLRGIKGASGATILGTGKVALIMDVPSLC